MSTVDAALDPLARRRIMTVLFIGVFMAAIDAAVIAPAVPALRDAFGVDNSAIGMVTIVFSLAILSSTALMAALGDRYGRRPVYLLCVAGFALGSLLIALAPSFWVVLLGRAVQGFSAGGINPTASAVVGDAFPPAERGKALGLIGATFGMAFLLGPLLASLILIALSWQWIFLINLPVAALVLWLGLRNLPRVRPSGPPAPLDWAGIALLALALTALVLGINRVLDGALGLTLWPFLLGAAALGLTMLVAVERRAARPVVPLRLFATRQLALTYVLCVGAGFGMGSVIFIASVAVEGLGVPPRQAGLLLIPLVLASSAGSVVFGRLLNSLGSRLVMLIGFATLAAGSALLALTGTGPGLWVFLPASLLVGLGVGIVVGGTLRTVVLNEVGPEERGAAQGLVNVGISVGNLLVVALLGAVADALGGGMAGLAAAYLAGAAVMAAMFLLSLGLKPYGEEVAAAVAAETSTA
ncbi:MAG TPA: MFS transporter [Chloroflexaceae bacterium]|nr:MFS transporter [Chloroflexaceae bacterium]